MLNVRENAQRKGTKTKTEWHSRQREQCEQWYGGRKQVCVCVCVCVCRETRLEKKTELHTVRTLSVILTSGHWDVIESLGPWKGWSLFCMCAI